MIIITDKGDYFIPDDLASNQKATVKQLMANAIPKEEWEKQQAIKELKSRIKATTPSDEILLQWANENHPDMQGVKQLQMQLDSLYND